MKTMKLLIIAIAVVTGLNVNAQNRRTTGTENNSRTQASQTSKNQKKERNNFV